MILSSLARLTAVTSALAFASVAHAQDKEIGAGLYADYCAVCHGASGKGDGDMANVLTIPSPNLTLLSKANDGDFPMLQVIHIIDGRTGVRAHGGAMPLFGNMFSEQSVAGPDDYGSVLETRGRVLSLAMYLESIQD